MQRLSTFLALLVVLSVLLADAADPSCPRKVVIRAHSSTDPSFTTQVAMQQLGGLLRYQSPNLQIVEQADKPEYVVAVTFERKPPNVEVGISLGAVDGKIPAASSKGTPLRTYYYGYLLTIFGRGIQGDEPGDLIPYLQQDIAARGGLERVLRGYEQIPVKAAAERDVKCIEHGEKRSIKLFEFQTQYPQTTSYSANARLVVYAEKGKVVSGTALQSDSQYKVLQLGSSPRKGDKTWVEYQAPSDSKLKTDTLHVYNACEILPKDVSALEQTQKQTQILEVPIPLCGDFQLEYDHRLIQTYQGTRFEARTTGMVPIQIKDRQGKVVEYGNVGNVPGKFQLEGQGTVNMKMQGSLPGGCSVTYRNSMKAKVSGTAQYEYRRGSNVLVLKVKVAESWGRAPTTMTMVCPNRTETRQVAMSIPLINWTKPLEFEDKEGAEVRQPFLGAQGSGTYHWILHVPER